MPSPESHADDSRESKEPFVGPVVVGGPEPRVEHRPVGVVVAGRYRLGEMIGGGAMGQVYRVEHVHTGETLALKALAREAGHDHAKVERFMREARTPARIRSDHVVKVIDADVAPELDGSPFFVMELLDGIDLQQSLRERGPLAAEVVVEILRQVAHALDRAHALQIVHRDLKPSNIFLHRRDADVVVKLLDFGISKLHEEGEALEMTESGAIVGTPLYMPPEQAQGSALVGPSADIWAMGMVAFKLMSGKPFWTQRSMADLLAAIVRDPLVHPSTRSARLPKAFDAWFFRSCRRAPTERWPTAGAQVAALAVALGVVPDETSGLSLSDFFDATLGDRADTRASAARLADEGEASEEGSESPSRASTVASGPRCIRDVARVSRFDTGAIAKVDDSPVFAGARSCVTSGRVRDGVTGCLSSESSESSRRRDCEQSAARSTSGARVAWRAVSRRD
jgi:serine/threonine protein kinase